MKSMLSFVLVAIVGLGSTALLTGCAQDDVGVRCQIAGTGGDDTEFTRFDRQALECESRVCIHYRNGANGPRCTIPCEDDSDCPSDTVAGCEGGFKCRYGQVFGAIQCCKFCVCGQDASGDDPLRADCAGKPVKCPNI